MIPLKKLTARLQRSLENNDDDSITLHVLLSTGALCPVHLMHLELMNYAKRYLEEEGHIVIGGFLSPSHDDYVGPKLRNKGITSILSDDRVEMVRLACEDSDWLDASAWESEQPTFIDYPYVTAHHRDYLSTLIRDQVGELAPGKEVSVKVVYVCGADHAWRCSIYCRATRWCDAVISVGRPGRELAHLQKAQCHEAFTLIEGEVNDLSSTSIRARMRANRSLKGLVPDQVANYIEQNGITIKSIGDN